MFEPIRTSRLLIRPMRTDDVDPLWQRRNDPNVAIHQNWALPYPRERAADLVSSVMAMDGPEDEQWWMAAVADPETEAMFGSVAIHLTWGGRTAEIGYELEPAEWGKGYAIEATEAVVSYLFDTLGAVRVCGMLHPDNRGSAMVLERLGMRYEGRTKMSFWVGDEGSDDGIYGMTREDWEAWRDRPRTPPADVRLAEVTDGNLGEVLGLAVHKSQESFVAPVATSLAQALVPPVRDGRPVTPWYRAIEADGIIAGFVMVALRADPATPYLWRLLIDRMHQRRGIAGRALDLVEDELRARGSTSVEVSWVDGRGSPAPFYEGRGYARTGEMHGREFVARKEL